MSSSSYEDSADTQDTEARRYKKEFRFTSSFRHDYGLKAVFDELIRLSPDLKSEWIREACMEKLKHDRGKHSVAMQTAIDKAQIGHVIGKISDIRYMKHQLKKAENELENLPMNYEDDYKTVVANLQKDIKKLIERWEDTTLKLWAELYRKGEKEDPAKREITLWGEEKIDL